MLPGLTVNDTPYITDRDSELIGNHTVRNVLGAQLANAAHVILGYFYHWMCNAAKLPTLCHLVGYVIVVRAKPKMGGIATRALIAARTIMQDMQAVWNRAIMQFPTETMCSYRFLVAIRLAANLDVSIAIMRRTSPQPTFVRAANGNT